MSLALFSASLGCGSDDSTCQAYADKVMKCDTAEPTANQDTDAFSRSVLVGYCRKGGPDFAADKACMKHQDCPAFTACEAEVQKASIKAAVDKAMNERK